jgi:ParB-like chromosome segregation protein Spo0J
VAVDNNVPKVVINGTTFCLPYRDRLPPLSPQEYQELKTDIHRRGIITPVIGYSVIRRGQPRKFVVIDGANRIQIAAELNIRRIPREDIYAPTQEQQESLADDLNLHRRHLSPEQRREYIAKVLKDKPQQSNRQVAQQTKTDHKTVCDVRAELEGRGEIPHVEKRADTKGRVQPAHKNGKARPARQEAKPAAHKDGAPEPSQETNGAHDNGKKPLVKYGSREQRYDPRNDPKDRKQGKGLYHAGEVLNWLTRIPKDDPERVRGMQMVYSHIMSWCPDACKHQPTGRELETIFQNALYFLQQVEAITGTKKVREEWDQKTRDSFCNNLEELAKGLAKCAAEIRLPE